MPHSKRLLAGAISLFLVLPALLPSNAVLAGPGDDAPGKCFLWQVPSKTATVYLLGSIHVADSSFYPLDATIERAFHNADTLVVELNLLKVDQRKLEQVVFQTGVYPADETLEKNLGKETLTKLDALLHEQGLSLDQVSRRRPWLVSVLLTKFNMDQLGYREALGIDRHFLKKATREKKDVLELESAEEQIDMLASWPPKLQELLLLSTIEEYPEAGPLMEKMVEAWKSGDADTLDKLVRKTGRDHPKLEPVVKKLFDDRNVKMAKQIEKYLSTDGTYFVVVGAGHLGGRKGIVQLLRDKGYDVRQLAKSGSAGATGLRRSEPRPTPAAPARGPGSRRGAR